MREGKKRQDHHSNHKTQTRINRNGDAKKMRPTGLSPFAITLPPSNIPQQILGLSQNKALPCYPAFSETRENLATALKAIREVARILELVAKIEGQIREQSEAKKEEKQPQLDFPPFTREDFSDFRKLCHKAGLKPLGQGVT